MSVRESAGGAAGRWGEGLTAAKMKNCCWLKPALVAQFEFVEWTPNKHPQRPPRLHEFLNQPWRLQPQSRFRTEVVPDAVVVTG